MKMSPFSEYSTEMLKVFSNEITNNSPFEYNHPLRVMCKTIYGSFSLTGLMSLSAHLAQELAERVETIDLNRKLHVKEKEELLHSLWGFIYEDDVLYTDYGDEFYDQAGSEKWKFETLGDFFAYSAFRSIEVGKAEAQAELRKAIGIQCSSHKASFFSGL